jgi:hypothetical protein
MGAGYRDIQRRAYTRCMKSDPEPRIVDAEKLDGGVILTFQDGKTAVYSGLLLRRVFSQAKELPREE